MLYIVLAYLMLFAALTNSVCLNNASLFSFLFLFYERAMSSPDKIALKNNHYYYYYSQIPDKYCNCHTCICFCFVENRLLQLTAVWFYS